MPRPQPASACSKSAISSAAETTRHLLGRQQVVGMAGQPRVMHLRYGRVRGEEFGDPLAGRADLPYRHAERLDPALHQPGFLRGGRRAQHSDVPADRGAHPAIGG